MYLVDTNVISAAAPTKAAPRQALVDWMDARSEALFLSAVSIAEIQDGIAKTKRTGAARKAADLNAWLETLLHLYGARILPFDAAVARVAGRVADKARARGRQPGFADIIIAATALHHGLKLLTRNRGDFEPLGVPTLDPFAVLPP